MKTPKKKTKLVNTVNIFRGFFGCDSVINNLPKKQRLKKIQGLLADVEDLVYEVKKLKEEKQDNRKER